MRHLLLTLIAFALFATTPFAARAATGDLCLDAISALERREAWMPEGLLTSIALIESGYRPAKGARWAPWPWTINSSAGAFYLDSHREAVAKVEQLQAQGVTNIDVGCMQINLRYHPDAFHSLDEAFRPAANVAYAARYLSALFGEAKTLFEAVGRYHSATPQRRDAYARKVFARWDKDAGMELPSRHGLGKPDSPRLVEREPQVAAREPGRVWSGIYGRDDASRGSLVERTGSGSWLRRSESLAPTMPRGAGQITFR